MSTDLQKAFAPTGKLRASIKLGNPILASKHPQTGEPVGVSIDLARAFAQRQGLDIELVVFDAAGKSLEAVRNEQTDIGFFANDPLRGEGIAFTAPYLAKFVEDMKASGFVADALKRHGIQGASIVPAT